MARPVKICVVDDHKETADVIAEGLREHDFDVVVAYSGEQALEICRKGGVEVALLDVTMPGMDGYELCERLKSSPETRDITVIFVTAKGEPQDHERGFDLGAVDYITKPFNLPMVIVRVEAAVRMRQPQEYGPADTHGFVDTAYTDQLTGLRNQRFLLERMQEELDKAHRFNFPVSCVILDLDGVRAVDAETGPVSIDDLLAEAAMAIRSHTRSYDVLARYDGTIFCALLPHTGLQEALDYGQKIMSEIEATTFADPNFPTKATMSVAVVTCGNGIAAVAEDIFGETMRTLLEAKSQPAPRIVGHELSRAA